MLGSPVLLSSVPVINHLPADSVIQTNRLLYHNSLK